MIIRDEFKISTRRELDFFDITCRVNEILEKNNIYDGDLLIRTPHTTCRPIVSEKEKGLIHTDFVEFFYYIAPKPPADIIIYEHDNFLTRTENLCPDEKPNGFAHIRAAMFPPSIAFDIEDGQISLGKWERIFIVEFDSERIRAVRLKIKVDRFKI